MCKEARGIARVKERNRTRVRRIADGNTIEGKSLRNMIRPVRGAHDVDTPMHPENALHMGKNATNATNLNHFAKMCGRTSKSVNMVETALSDYTYSSDSDGSETGESNAVIGTVTCKGVLEDEWTVNKWKTSQ